MRVSNSPDIFEEKMNDLFQCFDYIYVRIDKSFILTKGDCKNLSVPDRRPSPLMFPRSLCLVLCPPVPCEFALSSLLLLHILVYYGSYFPCCVLFCAGERFQVASTPYQFLAKALASALIRHATDVSNYRT